MCSKILNCVSGESTSCVVSFGCSKVPSMHIWLGNKLFFLFLNSLIWSHVLGGFAQLLVKHI